MPLQIRRGTDAERQLLVPATGLVQGELLYVTDAQKVYIGTGVEGQHQGLAVTGYTGEDAVDAVGTALVAGSHTNIAFTYGTTQDIAGRIDAAVNLSNYVGTIKADAFKGSVFGDDSTPMVDAINNTFNGDLSGDVTGNVLGNVTGNLSGNVTGNVTGNVLGNVVGNVTGNLDGDVNGSIFSDTSTLLVDGITGRLSNGTLTLDADVITGGPESLIYIGTATNRNGVVMNSYSNDPSLTIKSSIFGTSGLAQRGPSVKFLSNNGTLAAPTELTLGDMLGQFQFAGYVNGGVEGKLTSTRAAVQASIDNAGDLISEFATAKLQFFVANLDDPSLAVVAEFNSKGTFSAPVVQTGSYTTTERNALTPAFGMMIYNTTDNKFQGYQNTGGTTPQWVDLS